MSDLHDAPACIAFDGAVSVRNIDTARGDLLQALSQNSAIHVDCGTLESADLSFIQLLLAARRSAQSAGKQLLLQPPPAAALHDALRRGGFAQDGSDSDPFWSGG